MAENITASPNFTRIEQESGMATRDAINLLWRMLTLHKRRIATHLDLPDTESNDWGSISAVDQPTLLADELHDNFHLVGVGIRIELDPLTDTVTLINECCDDPCDTGYDVYYQEWEQGDTGDAFGQYAAYARAPEFAGDPIDPGYPEIRYTENTLVTANGPFGGNSIAPFDDTDHAVMAIQFELDHTWDAHEGCALVWAYTSTAVWDEIENFGAVFHLFHLMRNFGTGADSDSHLQVYFNLDSDADGAGRYMQIAGNKFGGGAVGNIFPGAALSGFTRAAMENKWQKFEIEWKCGEPTREEGGVVTSVATDGYIAVYHTNVGGSGSRQLIAKVSDIALAFAANNSSYPTFQHDYMNGFSVGKEGFFGEIGPVGVSSKKCCFPDGYGTSGGGGVTDCDTCVPGNDTEIIINDGGSFGSSANLLWTGANLHVTNATNSLSPIRASRNGGNIVLNPVSDAYSDIILGGRTNTSGDYLGDNDNFAYVYWSDGAQGVDLLYNETAGVAADFSNVVGYQITSPAHALPSTFEVYENGGLGTGAVAGMNLRVERNNSGNGAASTINLQERDGTNHYLWVDDDGKLRIHTSRPTEDNTTVAHTAGTVVGSQS